MIATDAKFKAHPGRRECQKRVAGSQELFRPRSGALARKNCENPPFDRHAGCARICIGKGCNYAGVKTGRQETLDDHDEAAEQQDNRNGMALWHLSNENVMIVNFIA
jgi:hypothetical protein